MCRNWGRLRLILALSSTLFFSSRKARKEGTKLWSPITKKLMAHMALPLLTGGALSAIMLSRGMYDLIAGITLIFYGFALVIAGLNKLFESRIKLGIMSILLVNHWVEYNTLKQHLEVIDGNLASHLKALESKELIEVKKQFMGKKPNTTYRCTSSGIKAFKDHLAALEKLIKKQ